MAVTAFLGEWVDSSVIFGVVLINAVVGFLQEAKAEKAIGALAKMIATEATVRRDGEKLRVPSEQLVPGDVVLLQSGDRVPADLRLLHLRNLQATNPPSPANRFRWPNIPIRSRWTRFWLTRQTSLTPARSLPAARPKASCSPSATKPRPATSPGSSPAR